MDEVRSLRALLIDCVRDLREGEAATLERLGRIGDAVRAPSLKQAFAERLTGARERAAVLEGIATALETSSRGPDNIWMSGMLEDAERDTKTVEPGPLLDAALVGAVRKMIAASVVSYETAIAVAARLGFTHHAAALTRCRDREARTDDDWRSVLGTVVASEAPPG